MNFIDLDLKTGKSKKASEQLKKITSSKISKKSQKATLPKPKNTKAKSGQGTQSKNPHKMNAKTKKIFYKAQTDYAIPRANLGFWDGITSATLGVKMSAGNKNIDTKKLYQSRSYKVGNIGGNMAGYGLGYGGVGKVAGKAATKVVTSQTGKRLVSKAAKTGLMKSAARKTLTKAGQNATTKAVEHAAKKQAANVAKGLVKGAVADATVGTFMNSQSARADGMKVGSKEWTKHMAESAALDFVTGGAVEIAPTALKALKKGSGKKTVQRVVDGKVKNVKVDKTYMDFAQESQKNALSKSKKAVETAQNEYIAAQNKLSKVENSLQSKAAKKTENVAKLNEMRQKKLSAAEKEFKQAELKLEKTQRTYDNAMKATLPEQKANQKVKAPAPNDVKVARSKILKTKAETKRFMDQVSNVMKTGEKPDASLIVRDTPDILKKYGVKREKITMPAKNIRKIAYPDGYLGLKHGHNLGFKALEELPKQLESPIAILDSLSQPNSRVIVTNLVDSSNRPVIVALHLDKKGNLSIADEVVSMYGRREYEEFIGRVRGQGKVLYENKKIGLDQLPARGLQLSKVKAESDPIFSIYKNAENVNEIKKRPRYQVSSNNAIRREDSYLSAGKSSDNSISDSAAKSNKYTTAKEAKIKEFDELFEEEVRKNAEYIRNYQKKGTVTDFVPDRNRLEAGWEAGDGFGYSTRHSDNDQWYQEFYRKNGRAPNKSEAEQIAREHLQNDLWYYEQNPSAIGDFELGASENLKKMSKDIKNLEMQETFSYALKDKDFMQYLDSYEDINKAAESAGKTVDEFVYDEYKTFKGEGISKDLGADVYKPSTQDINAEVYGQEQGVVNATPYGETSQSAKTIYNSPMMDETAKKIMQDDINAGMYAKYTKKNKVAMDNAIAAVDNDMAGAHRDFSNVVDNGRMATSEDIAKGYRLAQNYQKMGDYDSMMKVLGDVANLESEAGRTLQAMRMFSHLTPEAKAINAGKQINRLERATGTSVKVPSELIDKLSKATDEATANRLQKEIMRDVWSQIPASWTQKANAWRYMSMLANPKTHIRNILGNALFVPVKGMRNIVATGLEKAFVKSGDRTKAILTPGDKELINAGKDDFKQVKGLITGKSRYIEGARDLDAIVFNNKGIEWFRRVSGDLLEKEDEIFMGYAYKRSYAQYLKANGVKNIADAGEELLSKARGYATNEALNSTYRDASALADFFSNMKKYSNQPLDQVPGKTRGEQLIKKTASMAVDATVPFTKTPINIMRRGWDYSPGGLIQGMGKILKAGGDTTKLIEGIAKVSSGLTGTGIVSLGLYMGMHDMARGSLDTMSKEGRYAAQNGEQEYSIRIGDYTYSMDWAAPISMPFFVGVELGNDLEKDGFSFTSVLSSMKGMTDPIFNLSMLSGLNSALDTAFDSNPTLGVLGNIAESYAGQYIPTMFGQIAKTISPEKRTTTSTAENSDQKKMETFINRLENKIPFLADTNEPAVDLWGDTEKKNGAGDYLKAVFDNFISPGKLKTTKKSSVDTELNNLGSRLGEMNEIVPGNTSKQEYDKKFEGTTYHMSEHDLTLYKKAKGRYSQQGLQELFSTEKYQNMSDVEKKQAIKKVYDAAKDKATMEFLMDKGISKEKYKVAQMSKNQKKAYEKSGMDIDRFEALYKARDNYVDSDGSVTKTMKLLAGGAETYKEANAVFGGELSEHAYRNAKNLYTLGIKPKEVRKIAKGADTNGNNHYSTAELVAYLDRTTYSRYEKAYIFQALANWNAHNPYA